MSVQNGLMRHVEAVQNAVLPGDRIAFRLRDGQVGWIRATDAPLVLEQGFGGAIDESGLYLPDADALPLLAELLAGQGAYPFRNEAFDVRPGFDGEILTTIDRGALPWFGITAEGVHVNGIVEREDGPHIWIARRARNRHMDPGKLDHLCAGGIAAGMTADATLTKEAAEEAGLPEHLANQAVYTGSLRYNTLRPEGLRRDRLHCYDLKLPEDFTPHPAGRRSRILRTLADRPNRKHVKNQQRLQVQRLSGSHRPHAALGHAAGGNGRDASADCDFQEVSKSSWLKKRTACLPEKANRSPSRHAHRCRSTT